MNRPSSSDSDPTEVALDASIATATAIAPTTPIDSLNQEAIESLVAGRSKLDQWLIQASEWSSPILIKEARQALKSKQFQWTFLLLLVAIALWTLFAIVGSLPGIYFFATGHILLYGYLLLLIIPTVCIVPNAAYRSMASELDQGTYDVLSITPLRPLKIVTGKLVVAMVQSSIYFSALAPCIALTYLLRGVSLPTILCCFAWIATVSLAMSMVGLLLASLRRIGGFSNLLMIIKTVFALIVALILYFSLGAIVSQSAAMEPTYLWLSLASMFSVIAYGGLAILAAAAAMGTVGENHSTTLRCYLWLLSFMMLGWYAAAAAMSATSGEGQLDRSFLLFILTLQAFHWGVAGSFFVGERGVTSPRGQRSLPSHLLSQLFLTWTNPGSGPGFMFAVLSYTAIVITILLQEVWRGGSSSELQIILFGLVNLGYLVFYLGATRLILLLIPPRFEKRMVLSVTIVILLIAIGTLLPILLSFLTNPMGQPSYEWYTVFNPFWTYEEMSTTQYVSIEPLLIASLAIFGINFTTLTRDVTLVRIPVPQRVGEAAPGARTEPVIDPLVE